jgi:ribonuclease BN (tRNA processing enzyme)
LTSDTRTSAVETSADSSATTSVPSVGSTITDMSLTVLGCLSGMPAAGQASSGYLVETPAARLLLDCGPGIATALSARGGPESLDAVVISHFHTDHCYDLLPLGKALVRRLLRVPGAMPDDSPPVDEDDFTPVPLYVPRGAPALLRRWANLFPIPTLPLFDKAFELGFDIREYDPGDIVEVGDCEIALHGLRHAAPNCGTRITTEAGVIAYTGDTGMTDALYGLAKDADVLLAEATLSIRDDGPHGHLCGGDGGEVAAAANVGQLVLTHFISTSPSWLAALRSDAADAFSGPIAVAAPGDRFAVPATVPETAAR